MTRSRLWTWNKIHTLLQPGCAHWISEVPLSTLESFFTGVLIEQGPQHGRSCRHRLFKHPNVKVPIECQLLQQGPASLQKGNAKLIKPESSISASQNMFVFQPSSIWWNLVGISSARPVKRKYRKENGPDTWGFNTSSRWTRSSFKTITANHVQRRQ